MRGRKIMMMMAGLAPTPYERRQQREQRQLQRYARELQDRANLMEMTLRRERGEVDTKPMPFAKGGEGK